MQNFSYIKIGVGFALAAILFGGMLGLSFGCCEHEIKSTLKARSQAVLAKIYHDDTAKAKKVIDKSWVYFKRAHLHSQTMGVIAIVFSLLAVWLNFEPKFQMAISILGGLGSLGYGLFWLISGYLAPALGSTGKAKETVSLLAQFSGASFFIAGAGLSGLLVFKVYFQKQTG